MGHADRPWLDYALCVDTKSRGVRLPADERCESNPDPDGYSYRYGDANSNSYSYSYSDCHGDCNRYGNAPRYSNAHRYSNSDSKRYAYCNCNCYCFGDSYRYSYRDPNRNSVTNAPGYTNAQTAPDTGTALIGTIRAGTREQNSRVPCL